MAKRISIKILPVLAAFALGGLLQPFNHLTSFAQAGCQTFNETGMALCGRFLEYWQANGGVAQNGFPISNEFDEASDLNGKIYTVQYFERAVFEKHPENQPPYDVLLSQLGTLQYAKKYTNKEPVSGGTPAHLPSYTVARFFRAMGFDGGVAIIIQYDLLSNQLRERLRYDDPYYGLLGQHFPSCTSLQDAPRNDYSGNGPAWVLCLDNKGNTVAVFTLVKEGGEWKIDYVEPNALK